MPPGSLVPAGWVLEALEGEVENEAYARVGSSNLVDLTVEDVAELMGRCPSTVREWCRNEPALGARKLRGKQWRIPPAGLRRFQEKANGAHEAHAASDGSAIPTNDDLGSWREELSP